jgi:tetratricopeptide (TPR) repeat protein
MINKKIQKGNLFTNVLMIGLIVLSSSLFGQQNQNRLNLKYGPFSVGYQVKQIYDYSRTFKSKTDYYGNPAKGEIARPIQISIWYPARNSKKNEYMLYKRYYHAIITETDFHEPTDEEKQQFIELRKQILLGEWRVNRENIDKVRLELDRAFERTTCAIHNAVHAAGQYPIIIHMPGYNGSPTDHTILFEYLASHGYIVASIPNMDMYTRNIENEILSIEVQTRDMDFVLAYMKTLPFVDDNRVGTTGMSWGGMSNILFAQRNHFVDAVVTFDGAITMPEELKLIESLPGFTPNAFRSAYLQLLVEPKDAKFRPKDLRFFNQLKYADAYMLQFNDVVHDDFSIDYMQLRNLSESDEKRVNYLQSFARVICEYTLQFFNAYLKDDENAKIYLEKAPEENGVPSGMVELAESKKAHKYPPTVDEFIEIVRTKGALKAKEIYQKSKEVDPSIILFRTPQIGPLYMEAFNTQQYEEALEICRLWAMEYPQEVGPYFSMARVFRKMGKPDEAIECYKKVLEIAPEGRSAENAKREIEKTKEEQAR